MAWLVRGDRVLASCEIAERFGARTKGLLGRDGCEGAILLTPARGVHTFGMRFAVDVAFCDADMVVIDTVSMHRNRMGRPRLHARHVIEAEAGSFARWGLEVGDELEIRR
ncbi:MAG: DUF192 domain-containing protein [Acidimicrobiales bacterium]